MSGREPERLSPEQAEALYLECGQQLLAFALGLLRHREQAREVVQATFGKALEHAGGIPPDGRRAWLFRVARNEALAMRRRDGVARRAQDRLARQQSAGTPIEGGGETDCDPPLELVRAEQSQRIRDALDRLPEAQRWVVQQRFYEGWTFAEMAEALHVPLGTVLTRMRLALGKLEQALKEIESHDD